MGKTKREDFYESIVYKKSKWAGRWDKRFFRLNANRLEYWEGDVAKGAPKGRYRVDANSKVSTKGDDLVVIAVQKELFELRVESEAVMNAWLDKIGRAIIKARRERSTNKKWPNTGATTTPYARSTGSPNVMPPQPRHQQRQPDDNCVSNRPGAFLCMHWFLFFIF